MVALMLIIISPDPSKSLRDFRCFVFSVPVAGDLLLRRFGCHHWSPRVLASNLNSSDSSLFAGSFSTSSSLTVVCRQSCASDLNSSEGNWSQAPKSSLDLSAGGQIWSVSNPPIIKTQKSPLSSSNLPCAIHSAHHRISPRTRHRAVILSADSRHRRSLGATAVARAEQDGGGAGRGGSQRRQGGAELNGGDDDSRFGDSQIDPATSRSKSHKSILDLAIHGAMLGLKMRRHRREGGDEQDLIAG
ncbi:hypothetical protein U1Q18_021890 [Sarracenia purpurea var. burkii]